MCFSAAASFTASAVLGVTGTIAVNKVKTGRELPLAAIPLLFALQQFVEGLLWVSLKGTGEYALPLTYVYLFFALTLWPVYMPGVAYSIETAGTRKRIMALLWALGIMVGVYQYLFFILNPASGVALNRCVYYQTSIPYPILISVFYGLATVGAGLLSSHRIVKIFSLLVGISALIAWRVYATNFASIWCFFAAALSFMLLFHFVARAKQNANR